MKGSIINRPIIIEFMIAAIFPGNYFNIISAYFYRIDVIYRFFDRLSGKNELFFMHSQF